MSHFDFTGGDAHRIAERALKVPPKRRTSVGVPNVQPLERVDEGKKRVQRRRHLQYLVEQPGGLVGLHDLCIREFLNRLHRHRGACGPVQRLVQEERTSQPVGGIEGVACPAAEQAVAAAQMMIEEAERRAGGEGVQPERHLGQLDGHRVPIHAVDASLEHDASDDVPVVESVRVDGPAAVSGIVHDRLTYVIDPPGERRRVVVRHRFGLGHDGNHAVGEVVDQAHEEVSRTHGGVADA